MTVFLLFVANLFFSIFVQAVNIFLCDDKKVPKNAHKIKSHWFGPCNWECNLGFLRVRDHCCPPKPMNSTWSIKCNYRCDAGFIRQRHMCCLPLPENAIWQDGKTACSWKCLQGFVFDGQNCVDEIVAEVVQDYETKEEQLASDRIIEDLIEADVELEEHMQLKMAKLFVDELLDRLLEHKDINYDAPVMDWMDDLVDEFIQQKWVESAIKENQTLRDVDTLDKDFHNHTFSEIPFDSGLQAERQTTVDALDDEVEFLKATIRYQNERLKRRRTGSAQYERLERELADARSHAALLEKRAEAAHAKLNKAREKSGQQKLKILSVNAEKVEVQHGQSRSWVAIDGAVLDTDNANVCAISMRTVKLLGLSKAVSRSKTYISIKGVTEKIEQWPLIRIKVKIKDRVFNINAAVGGTTSILVSHPDVIEPLMKEDGYVIGVHVLRNLERTVRTYRTCALNVL